MIGYIITVWKEMEISVTDRRAGYSLSWRRLVPLSKHPMLIGLKIILIA